MESFSTAFRVAVDQLLNGPVPVLGTVGRGGGRFMQGVRQRADVHLVEVTEANRDQLPDRLVQALGEGVQREGEGERR
jgi:nucleoside-triphosphatase THEP1